MENEVKNDYIAKAINELVPFLGIRESIDCQKIIYQINLVNIKEAVETIARHLGLPVKVKISYVPKDYQQPSPVNMEGTPFVHISLDTFNFN